MEFGFVVGRHSLTSGKEKPIAGFLDIGMAKEYANNKELDYLSNGYMYVDTLEGRYILGANRKDEKNKWYAPNEKACVFDAGKDSVVSLDDCM